MMDGEPKYAYDVFLSYSSVDEALVRGLAERLRQGGLRVWFDKWALRLGDSIPSRIEEGLEHSRVLASCISKAALASDWTRMESAAFRFRDPNNHKRQFIPVLLDAVALPSAIAHFVAVDWRDPATRDREATKLLEACREILPDSTPLVRATVPPVLSEPPQTTRSLELWKFARAFAWSADGSKVAICSGATLHAFNLNSERSISLQHGQAEMMSVAWEPEQNLLLSGSGKLRGGAADGSVCVWNLKARERTLVMSGHLKSVEAVAWTREARCALSGSADGTARLWDIATGRCIHVLEGHGGGITCVAYARESQTAMTGSQDRTVRTWQLESGKCIGVLEGHLDTVTSVACSQDGRVGISGSVDGSVRVWDLSGGRCVHTIEIHPNAWPRTAISSLACTSDGRIALVGSFEGSIALWDLATADRLIVLRGNTSEPVTTVAFSADGRVALVGDRNGGVRSWDLTPVLAKLKPLARAFLFPKMDAQQVQYTNAKVLLAGESGAGKTGLSRRLTTGDWEPTDSTVGAWAMQWKLPVKSGHDMEREIWLWDFGGQADQRLIHQLYMNDTALAVLVFDGQKEDLFETLGQWDRDLTRASNRSFSKLLVAGRIDTGGLRWSMQQLEQFARDRGFDAICQTSAKTGDGCEELKAAIVASIRWQDIPWRASPALFNRLKQEIIRLKDEGRVLMRFNELREALRLRLMEDSIRFTDEELKAVIGLLASPGVVWELGFGSWVLLQPEEVNSYAQAVIRTVREDEHERGAIREDTVLGGDLKYRSKSRLGEDEERIVILAMHKMLIEHALCIREPSESGTFLIFPSFYRRERPDLAGHPAVHVSYRFSGFFDDVYATLVVRLHHTGTINKDQLWRHAADFKTLTGKQLGIKLTRLSEGSGELAVYFETSIAIEERIIFSKYVHEHVIQKGHDVVRLRHYVCPSCATPVGNPEIAMRRLAAWLEKRAADPSAPLEPPNMLCVECEDRFPLWDEMEQVFASQETQQQVRQLQHQSTNVLDKESRERALVGEVISTVALAGQIARETTADGHQMEIEFKSDAAEPTGRRMYLVLRSGGNELQRSQHSNSDVYLVQDADDPITWSGKDGRVMLVVRDLDGTVYWSQAVAPQKNSQDDDARPPEIPFKRERFDVMSVRRWRENALAEARER
jgi:small GTP-binding protein